ncbi:MAG: hypothetical protein K2O44_00510 [Clostridia bacterium]|nr:hypothetical protein [Clostridia bacterium]
MYKILRIICCVISAAILAACVFLFVYLGTFWGLISLLCAAIFFALTLLFKGLQEDYDKKHPYNDPVEPVQPTEPATPEVPDESTDDKTE